MIGAALKAASGPERLSILIFHRVLSTRDEMFPGEVTASEFDAICSWLKAWGTVLPLDEAADRLARGSLPRGAVCITFDDGYADNYDIALPILQRHGLCATFFIATGYLNGGRMWNDTIIEAVRGATLPALSAASLGLGAEFEAPLDVSSVDAKRAALHRLLPSVKYLPPALRQAAAHALAERSGAPQPNDLMMRSEQVVALRRGGMQVGAHTVTHPILAKVSEAEALQEMGQSREVLQGLLGEPVTLFAYPNGRPGQDYTERDAALVPRAGFKAAVSTRWAAARRGDSPFELPRYTPWDRTRLRFGLRMARTLVGV